MKRVVVVVFACLLCVLSSCLFTPKPEAMNDEERRVYDALVLMARNDSTLTEIVLNGIDTGYLPEHLNIDVDMTYTQNDEKKTVLVRLVFNSGEVMEDPYGYYCDTAQSNEYMKILNINYALEQYFKGV